MYIFSNFGWHAIGIVLIVVLMKASECYKADSMRFGGVSALCRYTAKISGKKERCTFPRSGVVQVKYYY